MTLKYFQKLSQSVQCRELLVKGACIGERRQGDAPVLLFQVGRFYVEVLFEAYTDEVAGFRCFEDTDELKPYLEQIDLTGLW